MGQVESKNSVEFARVAGPGPGTNPGGASPQLATNTSSHMLSSGGKRIQTPSSRFKHLRGRGDRVAADAREKTLGMLRSMPPVSSHGIRIGEVRIFSPTPAMISVGVTVSSPVI